MQTTESELKELVEKGIIKEIFIAERSYILFNTISDYAEQINSKDSEYTLFLSVAQSALSDEAVMAVARLYDKPSTKHKTRCIHELLDFLGENESKLQIMDEMNTFDQMKRAGFSIEDLTTV